MNVVRWAARLLPILAIVALFDVQPVAAADVFSTYQVTMQSAAVANGNGTVIDVGGLAALSLDVGGTFVATVNFEGTGLSGTFTAINCFNQSTTPPAVVQTATAAGTFLCAVGGLQQVRARVSGYSSGSVTVKGDGTTAPAGTVSVAGTVTVNEATTDPCQSSAVAKVSTPLAISTATTTQLVALATGKQVFVCSFSATLTGTTPTAQLDFGTGTACATGPVNLTGAYAPTAGGEISGGFGGTLFATTASNALCVITTGTSPSLNGFLTYVQQ